MSGAGGLWRLVDETVEPTLRESLGQKLQAAERADFAVARIRLAALDLTEAEVAAPIQWRVLLGQLDAAMLLETADGFARPALDRLMALARSGRLQVRSAGLGAWVPDFAVVGGASGMAAAVGAIYFGRPALVSGPSLTVWTEDPEAVRRVRQRFEGLWELSHDVLPAIVDVLERVRRSTSAAAPGRASRRGGAAEPTGGSGEAPEAEGSDAVEAPPAP